MYQVIFIMAILQQELNLSLNWIDLYEGFYVIETDKENIEELFAEMLVVVESKSRKNSSCHAFIISYKKLNLEPIQQLIPNP